MNRRHAHILTAVAAAGLLLAGFGLPSSIGFTIAQSTDAQNQSVQTVTGITKPSEKRELTISMRGQISEIPVKEGDHVKAGQLIMAEDDRVERAEFDRLTLLAQSTVGVRAATADMKVKEVSLANIRQAYENNASNELELKRAEAEYEVARLSIEKAKEDAAIRQKEADRQAAVLQMMRINSPINGIVAKLDIGVGEIVDPQKPVCTLVNNTPLWIEAYVPTHDASRLKLGQTLQVRYPDEDQWQSARVTFFSPMANAAADTRLIRLELDNPDQRESGLQIFVHLPTESATTDAQ